MCTPGALMSSFRPFHQVLGFMMSHHVTCHVTAVSRASSLSKRKEKEKENKISIKSENKRKRK